MKEEMCKVVLSNILKWSQVDPAVRKADTTTKNLSLLTAKDTDNST